MKNCIFILMSALWLGGCGPEVLTWDEEVLLNTGETIIVHRKAAYTLSGEGGNPLKMSMHPRPDDMVIYFDYHGRRYRYVGSAELLLLAISPQGIPNLVILPRGFGWDYKNCFNFCAEPYYGQLIPDDTGLVWSFPENIDSWLYGLMGNISPDISYNKIKSSGLISSFDIKFMYEKSYVPSREYISVDPGRRNPACGSARCSPELKGKIRK